jgi:hypothetical protein
MGAAVHQLPACGPPALVRLTTGTLLLRYGAGAGAGVPLLCPIQVLRAVWLVHGFVSCFTLRAGAVTRVHGITKVGV